jgi:hypothetical protein
LATLHEYFRKDSGNNLSIDRAWPLTDSKTGEVVLTIEVRLFYDFDANAKYVSFYFPASDKVQCPEALALRELGDAIDSAANPYVSVGLAGYAEKMSMETLQFTGRVFLYSERPLDAPTKEQLTKVALEKGHYLVFRSIEYMDARNKAERPLAFISHDSRDKDTIAEPSAIELQKLWCPVWFDQFSLKVGDSLRESIEAVTCSRVFGPLIN